MKFLAIAAGLVASVSAFTYPTPFNPTAGGASPSGNPITLPNTNSPVTLGKAYDITWTATTPGPVALVLCKGPSTNCEPILSIVDETTNSGVYSWTPTGLDPSATSTGGYGIMLIDWTTQAYQYTTQFGVLAGDSTTTGSTSSASTSSTTTVTILPSSSAVVIKPTPSPVWSTVVSYSVSTTVVCPESTAVGTGSLPQPTSTGSPSVPTSIPSSGPSVPKFSSGADRNMISFGAVGAMAGLAALLAF